MQKPSYHHIWLDTRHALFEKSKVSISFIFFRIPGDDEKSSFQQILIKTIELYIFSRDIFDILHEMQVFFAGYQNIMSEKSQIAAFGKIFITFLSFAIFKWNENFKSIYLHEIFDIILYRISIINIYLIDLEVIISRGSVVVILIDYDSYVYFYPF